MTGLAGVWTPPGGNSQSACGRVLQALCAFGDQPPEYLTHGSVTFGRKGHSRLGPNGQGPAFGSRDVLIVSDAQIDNLDELRSDLKHCDRDCTAGGVASLLLLGWQEWGLHLAQRLVGSFAIAIFEPLQSQLTLIRDPLGNRPLFYVRAPHALAFASMPSGLMALPWGQGAVDPQALAAELSGRFAIGAKTLFRGIKRVPAGHVVVLTASETTEHRFWKLPREQSGLSRRDLVEAYRFELDRAVSCAMKQHTGTVAAHLSSGLDSSAVASTAAKLHGPGLSAFTAAPRLGFAGPVLRGWLADESPLAAQTAQMHQMRHHIIRSPGGLIDVLQQHAAFYQAPCHAVVNKEWWSAIASKASAEGAGVMLTAEHGNLTLNAGGVTVLADWLRHYGLRQWYKQMRAFHANNEVRWRGLLYGSAEPWLPRFVDDLLNRLFLHKADLERENFVRPEWRLKAGDRRWSREERRDGRRWMVENRADAGTWRKGTLAQHNIDERDPTSDARLVEFSFRLPPEQLLCDGASKPLAREALSDRVPMAVLNSKYRGMQSADWAERLTAAQARDVLDEISSSHGATDLLDIPQIESAIARWPKDGLPQHGSQMIFRNWLPRALSAGLFIKWNETVLADAKRSSMTK